MSEYQYYEFRAIDRPLTDRQTRELRAISTRAAISRTSFSNHYEYGDLKANPARSTGEVLRRLAHFANWLFRARTVNPACHDVRQSDQLLPAESSQHWCRVMKLFVLSEKSERTSDLGHPTFLSSFRSWECAESISNT